MNSDIATKGVVGTGRFLTQTASTTVTSAKNALFRPSNKPTHDNDNEGKIGYSDHGNMSIMTYTVYTLYNAVSALSIVCDS